MNGYSRKNNLMLIAIGVGGFALLLILFIFSGGLFWQSGHSPRLSPAPASRTKAQLVSSGPLTIKGCLSVGVNRNRIVLEFKNNTLWSLHDIRITKACLGGQFPINNKVPIVIKAIGGQKDLQMVLEFPKVSSRYIELEIEYRGGVFGGIGEGSLSCRSELPLCSSSRMHSSP
jgi:hypothetical protein